ncbi:MAG: hypothetical protein AAF492_18395, partial [Verrucomicrobiota bacterium]
PIPPPVIDNLVGDPGADPQSTIDIGWDPAPNPGDQGANALSGWRTYRVYISGDGDTPNYTDPFIDISNGNANLGVITTTNAVISNLTFGTEYRLSVVGLDLAGNIGLIVNVATVQLAGFSLTSGVAEVMSVLDGNTNAVRIGWDAFAQTQINSNGVTCVGENFPATGSGVNWNFDALTAPLSLALSDDQYASYGDELEDNLILSDIGFNIPAGADIAGIQVNLEGRATANNPDDREFEIDLSTDAGGSTAGDTFNLFWTLADTQLTVGGPTNLWGTTWTVGDINSTDFAVQIRSLSTDSGQSQLIDQLSVTVCYTGIGAATNVITKVYDVLFQNSSHWTDASSNRWLHLWRGASDHMTDVGQISGITPREMGMNGNPSMRFYRAALRNQWQQTNNVRLATAEIYVMKAIHLYPGQNWVGFPGVPDQATPAFIFGELLPCGTNATDSTRITWFDRTTNTMVQATNSIYLRDMGAGNPPEWFYTPTWGNTPVTAWRMPMRQACMVEIPPGAGRQTVLFIGKVPSNATSRIVSGDAANLHHTFFGGLNQPRIYHPT